VNTHYFDIDFT